MKAIALLLVASGMIAAQSAPTTCAVVSPEAAKMHFDVVSVKPTPLSARGQIIGGPGSNDPGHVTMPRMLLAFLIFRAYDVGSDQVQGPGWMSDTGGHAFTISATMPETTTKEQYCGMLRNLLADRFHLTFHHETQARPAYELTVLPGGPKFKQYVPGQNGPTAGTDADGFPVMPPNQPDFAAQLTSPSGLIKMIWRINIPQFARFIGGEMSQNRGGASNEPIPRVADKTGLSGSWDIRLAYQPTRNVNTPPPLAGAEQAPTPEGPDIVAAVQQQLALKIQKVKDVPIDVLVVDHVDQTPTEN